MWQTGRVAEEGDLNQLKQTQRSCTRNLSENAATFRSCARRRRTSRTCGPRINFVIFYDFRHRMEVSACNASPQRLRPSHPRFPICMYEHGGQNQCVFKRACSTLASTTTNTAPICAARRRKWVSRLEETTRNSQGAIEYNGSRTSRRDEVH